MNKNTANFLYLIVIVIFIAFIIFTISYIVRYKQAFFENPFVYGTSKMKNVGPTPRGELESTADAEDNGRQAGWREQGPRSVQHRE